MRHVILFTILESLRLDPTPLPKSLDVDMDREYQKMFEILMFVIINEVVELG